MGCKCEGRGSRKETVKIYYRDDFDFRLHLYDENGEEIGLPEGDWELRFIADDSYGDALIASKRGEVLKNCCMEGKAVRIAADRCELGLGRLKCDVTVWVPDDRQPDEKRRMTRRLDTNIELVSSGDLLPSHAEAEVSMPWIPVPTLEETRELQERTKFLQERTKFLQGLPFVFDNERVNNPDCPLFTRGGRYFRKWKQDAPAEPVSPEESLYNVYNEEGEIEANPRALFRCGSKLYRVAGGELIDVEIERMGGRLYSEKCIRLNSHPGILHPNNSSELIIIPEKMFKARDGGYVLDLRRLYYMDQKKKPLSGCELHLGNSAHPGSYKISEDGNELWIDETLYGIYQKDCLGFHLPGWFEQFEYIGCRVTSGGDKVFYGAKGLTMAKRKLPPLSIIDLSLEGYVEFTRGGEGWTVSFAKHLEVQAWERKNDRQGLPDSEDKRKRRARWRWRWWQKSGKMKKEGLKKKLYLMRVRQINNRGHKSDWMYFQLYTPYEQQPRMRNHLPQVNA